MSQTVKNPPAMWETWVWSLDWEAPLQEGMATHCSIGDGRISCPENRHVQRSLAVCRPWRCKESDSTEQLSTAHSTAIHYHLEAGLTYNRHWVTVAEWMKEWTQWMNESSCIFCVSFDVSSPFINDKTKPPSLFKNIFFLWEPFLKSILNLLQYCFYSIIQPLDHEACRVLTPWLGTEPAPPALEGNVLTTRPPESPLEPFSLHDFSVTWSSQGMFPPPLY